MMNKRGFGATELEVSPFCLGTYTLSGAWGPLSERDADLVRHAFDRGVNFFDTAFAYGGGVAEEILGKGLGELIRSRRDDVVIVTKGGLAMARKSDGGVAFNRDASPNHLRLNLLNSLERLRTDHVDVFLIHWFDPNTPIEESALALKGFVDEGLVRYIGVSNYTLEQMQTFRSVAQLDVVQVPYNLFAQYTEDIILPYCSDNDIAVMGYAAVAQGYLTDRLIESPTFGDDDWRSRSPEFTGSAFVSRLDAAREIRVLAEDIGCSLAQFAIAWTLAHSANVIPVVGTRNVEHLAGNLDAFDVRLSPEIVDRAREIGRRVPPIDYSKVAPV